MNQYKEIITEDALIEMANRYIQLEKEFEEFKKSAIEEVINCDNYRQFASKKIDDLEKKLSIANKFIASQKEYYENLNQLKNN
jgi:hypothetical protein